MKIFSQTLNWSLICLLLLASATACTGNNPNAPPKQIRKLIVTPALPLAPIDLLDHRQQRFDLQGFKSKWSLVFFGYTHCPDICPVTLSELAEAYSSMDNSLRRDTQVVFVSVDPQRDSPRDLSSFVKYFNSDFIGLTGTPTQIDALTHQLGVVYHKVSDPLQKDAADYLVNHSAAVYLIDPRAELVAKFPAPHYSERIASQYQMIRTWHARQITH